MLKQFQAEHKEWVDREYPDQPPIVPACGCVEEAGELMRTVLKMTQKSVWGEEARYKATNWNDALVDAVGDCAIYACSLCNACGWDFEEVVQQARIVAGKERPSLDMCAVLVRISADVAQHKSNWSVVQYLRQLLAICTSRGLLFEQCVAVTWDLVKERRRDCSAGRTGQVREEHAAGEAPSAAP